MFDRYDIQLFRERHGRRIVLAGSGLIALILIGSVSYWWMEGRWRPPPSIFDTPVDDVMGYLAVEDFNQLPLEERIAFVRDFADRFRSMEQSESAVLAGFMAGLTGPTREQLRQNVRELGKDILADGAREYLALKTDQQRKEFIDNWLVEWLRVGERIAEGETSNRSDEKMLADIREQGREEARSAPEIGPLGRGGAMEFLDFWQSDVEAAASPVEQGRIVHFLKDVREHILR